MLIASPSYPIETYRNEMENGDWVSENAEGSRNFSDPESGTETDYVDGDSDGDMDIESVTDA